MRSFLKDLLERMSGYQTWLEPSANPQEIKEFLKQIAPVSITRPLIRLGSETDGGYLAPDDLDGIGVTVSPGVSTEVSFDHAMAEMGMEIYMADASVDGPPVDHKRFHFHSRFLDVFEDENNMRLDTLCQQIKAEHSGDRLLQMDIEGAEYRVLLDASEEVLKSFRIMLIEFHELDRMYAAFPLKIIRATFQKLLRTHYIVHAHPNNVCPPRVRGDLEIPQVMEYTFYRKGDAKLDPAKPLEIPHPLDSDNVQKNQSYNLPKCLY